MEDFDGVKIALIKDDQLLVILRDDKPGLRNANLWDLPGGGREGHETQFECVAREVDEELKIQLSPDAIIWEKTYPAMHDSGLTAYFMAAHISDDDIRNVVFGDEGQCWKMMSIADFMSDPTVIEALKGRMRDYLGSAA